MEKREGEVLENRKTIFQRASLAKRLMTRSIKLYSKTLAVQSRVIEPSDSSQLRFLVHSMGGIGNSLMATPLVSALKGVFPNAKIDMLTSPGAASLLQGWEFISELFVEPSASALRIDRYLALERILATRKYDAALLPLNAHTLRLAVRATLARIPVRVCHEYKFRPEDDINDIHTNVVVQRCGTHDVRCNLDLLSSLCKTVVEPGPLCLPISNEESDKAFRLLREKGLEPGRPCFALCPGSSGWMSFKRWPLPLFIDFATRLSQMYPDWYIALFLGPEEMHEADFWERGNLRERIHVIQALPLRQYAAAIKLMSMVIANDSLPMHVACALQIPVVALFGPTDPLRTGPWHCRNRVVRSKSEYSGYFELPYPLDPNQFPDVMAEIRVDEVLRNVASLLEEPVAQSN